MDEHYDYVVLGTGLKECILCALLSIEGKKVLHIDRNDYYGGKSTSLNPLKSLFENFGVAYEPDRFKNDKDWFVDLIPKFIMAAGNLVKLLHHTGVLKYLEFKQVDGSFVYHAGQVHKVPCNDEEALASNLMNVFEKRRFRKLLVWAMDFNINDPSTYNSVYPSPNNVNSDPIMTAFTHFGINEETQNFIGHAICLYPDDSYKQTGKAVEAVERMQLYSRSMCTYGKSPYVYPVYGLGELSQSFARLSAVHGGTFMLRKPVDELVMQNGKVVGVKSEGEVVSCDAVICDPSYAMHLVKNIGKVIRAICLLNHPIPGTGDAASAQVIIPQNQTQYKHDIYISFLSHSHKVCPEGFFVAIVAKTVETATPEVELKPGLDILGPVEQVFYSTDDLYEPLNDGRQNRVFVSCSYDASTHFETTCADVVNLYERISGHAFDFSQLGNSLAALNANR